MINFDSLKINTNLHETRGHPQVYLLSRKTLSIRFDERESITNEHSCGPLYNISNGIPNTTQTEDICDYS